MSKLLEMLSRGILIGDGAMGSFLSSRLGPRPCLEEANITHPDEVISIHLEYIAAGANIIETNTFAANAARLRELGLEERTEEINSRAVKLAREAREISGREVIIAGSIGPVGFAHDLLRQEGWEQARQHYRQQAEILEQRGVEAFIIETFASPRDLRIAVEAVRSISSLPIMAQLTFAGGEFADFEPGDVSSAFAEVEDLPIEVFGVNCGIGPREALRILEKLPLEGERRLSVYPNVGLPMRSSGRYVYPDSSPGYFSAFALEAARLGARVVGGCCGTRPEHIAAIAEALKGFQPPARRQFRAEVLDIREEPAIVLFEEADTQIAQKFRAGAFVTSVQIDPPKGAHIDRQLEAVNAFLSSGLVDAVDVNSNPMARLHMDSLWMSLLVERIGMESIPHVTPRDASIMGLQANLLGAHALGVRNLLVITGDPSQLGGTAGERDIYQVDSLGLVKLLSEMNQGRDATGNLIGEPTHFFIGVAVNPTAPDLEAEARRFGQKIENGARFAMTQVFFDWDQWDRFLEVLGGEPAIPVMAAVWPLTSYRLALRLHHEVPGISVPDGLLKRLEAAGAEARQVGFEQACAMFETSKERVQGAYIIAPFKDPITALQILKS
jgi:methionine synthase / methylenetetrahydrofolate reductase(NADPH)